MTTGSRPAATSTPRNEHPTATRPIGWSVLLADLDTAALEAIATAAIDILDLRTGDCDLEDDDPCGHALDAGEHPTDDGRSYAAVGPRYGIDQSRGPINSPGRRQRAGSKSAAGRSLPSAIAA